MFSAPLSSGLTFAKVLSGLSKTLSVANQVIPLYKEAKPMINNAKTILSVLKGMNNSNNNTKSTNVVKNNTIKKEIVPDAKTISNNNPRFFL